VEVPERRTVEHERAAMLLEARCEEAVPRAEQERLASLTSSTVQ
jgi:hypothetical protein